MGVADWTADGLDDGAMKPTGSSKRQPQEECCSAVANINAAATTPAIRRDLCRCFKKAGHGACVVSDKAKQLPRLCDVRVAVPIDPTVNCGS
ncbi:hypothetical protein Godav_017230 [Gossypium davidsonii]|uniref:Bifunctional inhibitor/plant lipid transfer protein/seed storage helical domain-containing protein n=1 Tax=Gossypium davidsonii TaxID=34287 RepID=A0A7J8QSP0_GOSDV|nr:hypothetical protein [Gossypium davidsonii]